MWVYPTHFDIIVVGGGHAGCEAAHAAACGGAETLLLSMSLDTVAKMSCNPAVGGIGKGHLVREIDALGGLMGKITEATAIQSRMLNRSKGPAVWAPRAQADKALYALRMKQRLEQTPRLSLMQGTAEEIKTSDGAINGVITKEGVFFRCRALIITSGTFLRGLIHIGEHQSSGGRAGDPPAVGLSAALAHLGLPLARLKTGTPPRLLRRSIDFSKTEEQPPEEDVRFSSDPFEGERLPQLPCHITYTTEETKAIISANLHRSLMYSGKLAPGTVGPRYCPSIEDKVVRFADKERHQIFLEPEGLYTEEIYVNGVSTSLPQEVQYDYIRSIPALRNAIITRAGYAIEYDFVPSGHLSPTLEVRHIPGLYLAGQINGTTGYEEAAAQGLMAGINAAHQLAGRKPLVLQRSEAYIGVLIDDLITKDHKEPYRMFTSRAEHRLLLRQDNADYRLREYGYAAGLIDGTRYHRLQRENATIAQEIERLRATFCQSNGKAVTLLQLLARPENTYASLHESSPAGFPNHGNAVNMQLELYAKYEGYIARQQREVAHLAHTEDFSIPLGLDFFAVRGLRFEAMEKLSTFRPHTLGQASRLAGVSPADITVLRVALNKKD